MSATRMLNTKMLCKRRVKNQVNLGVSFCCEEKILKEKILIVEDDISIARCLLHNLRYEGYEVRHASHGDAVFPILESFEADLILLDWVLPGKSGIEILKELRESGNEVQVLILSARSMEDDKVEGLMQGADGYITKPFGVRELIARVEAALRRLRLHKSVESSELRCLGDLEIDLSHGIVRYKGEEVKLTPKAYELLCFLSASPGKVYSRDVLLDRVWGKDYEGGSRTVDNFILQLRNVLEEDPSHPRLVETVYGRGYKFSAKV